MKTSQQEGKERGMGETGDALVMEISWIVELWCGVSIFVVLGKF